MELHEYTKKTIRRLALAIAGFGVVVLAAGLYQYDLPLASAGAGLLILACMGYGVGS